MAQKEMLTAIKRVRTKLYKELIAEYKKLQKYIKKKGVSREERMSAIVGYLGILDTWVAMSGQAIKKALLPLFEDEIIRQLERAKLLAPSLNEKYLRARLELRVELAIRKMLLALQTDRIKILDKLLNLEFPEPVEKETK